MKVFFSLSPPLLWEYVMEHEDVILDNKDNHIFPPPTISPRCEEYSFMLEDTCFETHGNLVSPFPNAPNLWRDLFKKEYLIISKDENDSCPSLDASPSSDEVTLQKIFMDCDISPTKVENMTQENETLENKDEITSNRDNHIIPSLSGE
jgi:hypothetical protein